MCEFSCIYERGGLCILDNEPCTDECEHDSDCRYCEEKCEKKSREA